MICDDVHVMCVFWYSTILYLWYCASRRRDYSRLSPVQWSEGRNRSSAPRFASSFAIGNRSSGPAPPPETVEAAAGPKREALKPADRNIQEPH